MKNPVAKQHDEVRALSDGDELSRWNLPTPIMRPARQRFEANNAIGAEVDLRLILDGELFVLQRMM